MKDYQPITVLRGTAWTAPSPEPLDVDLNEAYLSPGEWWRQPPHEIRRGSYAPYRGEGLRPIPVKTNVLAPTGKRTLRYDPAEEPELLNALLDVAQGRLKPVNFANQFGLLGYNYLVSPENICKGGDPLDWFLAHAKTVYVLSRLIGLLDEVEKSPRAMASLRDYLLKRIPLGAYAMGPLVKSRAINFGFWKEESARNPVAVANRIIQKLLNANLGRADRWLQQAERGLQTIFTFRALVNFVYWQLADQLGHSSIHQCRECGRTFIHPNPRILSCPPAEGKKISPCKSRWNVRKFRKEHKRPKRRRKP